MKIILKRVKIFEKKIKLKRIFNNYVGYYDTNIKNNKAQNGINEVETNNDSFKDENDVDNIKNYKKFKGAPVLNINLKTKEDEDL